MTFRIKIKKCGNIGEMQKYKKDLMLLGDSLGIMRRIFKIDTLPDNSSGIVFVFNAITFINAFLILYLMFSQRA